MRRDHFLPTYEQLFGELDFRAVDEARSVYSPAAYLVDLLQLIDDNFDGAPLTGSDRRADITAIPLDTAATYTEVPYLDVVNRVLATVIGPDAGRMHELGEPYSMPFDFDRVKVRGYLRHLGVDPVVLHGLFDDRPNRDAFVREYLGLSAAEVALLTTVAAGVAGPQDPEAFRKAVRLTEAELDDLLKLDNPFGKPVPAEWFERVGRFVRLARRVGLSFADLEQVLHRCCANVIDVKALRILAAILRIHRDLDLPIGVVVNLVAPLELPVPEIAGDILSPSNRESRKRLAELTGLSEAGIVGVVRRVRQRYPGTVARSGPFDAFGLGALSLLYRTGQLTTALDISVDELFGLLDALGTDATVLQTTAFGVREIDPVVTDLHAMLEAPDVESALCLIRLLTGVVRWLRAHGLDISDFGVVLGSVEGDWEPLELSLDGVAFGPEIFVSQRFGERASQVVHDVLVKSGSVVSQRDPRLLRPSELATAAYDALSDLAVVTDADFRGLGLAETLAAKIRTNLVLLGHVDAEGLLLPDTLTADFVLSNDFDAVQEPLLALIGESETLYPSNLAQLDLAEAERAELYDNLVALGYLDPDGTILSLPSSVTVPLDNVRDAVLEALQAIASSARAAEVSLDPEIFAELPVDTDELLESLRFNGYVDRDGNYTDITALTGTLAVDISFHPYRASILEAMQAQLAGTRAELLTVDDETFAEIADTAAAAEMAQALDGTYLVDDRVPGDMREFFADGSNVIELTTPNLFTHADLATATSRIRAALAEQQPYRFDLDAVAELGFDEDEAANLVGLLVARGDLDDDLVVPQERLARFGQSAAFSLPGMEDYALDVFYLLHVQSRELTAAIAEITTAVTTLASQQRTVLLAALADAIGLPVDTTEAICTGVAGSVPEALDQLLGGSVRAHDRIRRFALLATRLGLDATTVAVVFHDQDLAGSFSEPLLLPPGVTRVDALLESSSTYLFNGQNYWIYAPGTEVAVGPKPLTDLSPRFALLTSVDAAFVDGSGTEWIISGTHAFAKAPGTAHWDHRDQVWGQVHSNFAAPQRIDSAFVDDEGRTYLFRGDQYVRYSGTNYEFVDEGYPREIGEWWEGEGRQTPVPDRFRSTVDASFQDRDGTTHLFSGDHTLALGDTERPTAGVWGRVRNTLADTTRIDAAYTDGAATVLFSGNQVVRYSDCVENDGVTIDEGFPLTITTHLRDVPTGFDGALDAALRDGSGVVHLFKDGRTTRPGREPEPTAQRWGQLGPVLTDGAVDSAFVGLDGMTYLFSGENYLRYSGADYSVVDAGYPRKIAGDWGGLVKVGASFVLDGATHLFGKGGLLFEFGVEHEADLNAGVVSRALREKLQEHGITVAAATTIIMAAATSPSPTSTWRLTADRGIALVLQRVGERIEVRAANDLQYHVRYSTNSYATPDAGYPRPLAENWWNLPDTGFGTIDAVFTGRDDRTYLFSERRFVVFDGRRRWWSEPREIREHWDSLPFDRVDAAFVGKDGKTYFFSRQDYVRYSNGDYTKLDERFPAPISSLWGNVVNNIARHGRVDAALTVGTATYLFSGNQYVRHDGTRIADGYPRALDALKTEPGFANLPPLAGPIDAAFADRRNIYLVADGQTHVVSSSLHARYDVGAVRNAFMENGSVLAETPEGWQRVSSLEGTTVSRTSFRPRTLRTVPTRFRDGLDAILKGADGTTYLFKGTSCYDTGLKREFPLAEDWGRGRNTIADDNRVDAAFVGKDGRTYVFSGDQYVVYAGEQLSRIDGEPRLISEGWGLNSVTLAYVTNGTTYVFEHPAEDGSLRYLTFSGTDYGKPDDVPQTTDANFWGLPERAVPDAVLVEGDTYIFVLGETYLTRKAGTWSSPRPVSRLWPGIQPGPLTTVFVGRDTGTYLFSGTKFTRVADGKAAPYREIRDAWGRSRNNFADGGSVDAAFVDGDGLTFLFSGDQYVRYSGASYRFVDPGYPKLIADNLRTERTFANLPETFEDVIADRVEAGSPVLDAVIANPRTAYLFVGESLHVVSRTATASVEITGQARNLIAETGKVDAALVTNGRTLLFSGDQYVRYSGSDTTYVDEGYPRTIEAGLAADLGRKTALPVELQDGVDAAFRATNGTTYLFAGQYWFKSDTYTAQPLGETWGRVRNEFLDAPGLDAAFVATMGELYVFRGRQYARYSGHDRTFVDMGFPRTIENDWGDLPFERGIDAAFVLNGRTYLGRGDDYVRYSGRGFHAIDRGYPQTFRQRWSGSADYRFDDVHTIARFAELARKHAGLAELVAGQRTFDDPYAALAGIFGWDVDELRWLVRRRGLLTRDDERVELELLHGLVDVFDVARKFGTGPSTVHQIWTGLRGKTSVADQLYDLLAHRFSPQDWKTLERQVHDELTVALRDALLSLALHKTGAETSRELFEQLLIDVDMGSRGMTSPIREAIAATQLFLHRYFMDLEPATISSRETREKLRARWEWMRNYRTWEANRKVFLYPENYLRPELREGKTPAFKALENDLLQGEITPEAVERAYKRYLDEYTEVSRLAIAGGHVFAPDDVPGRDLVLFGRTRTQPRRYYYRRARFSGADKLTAAWDPWLKVDVQIDADEVHPVHAFNRVFVFWTTKESVQSATTSTTLTTKESGKSQEVTAPPQTERVRIHYSFYNLNGEWVPAQTLAMDTRRDGSIFDVRLAVEVLAESISVTCTYSALSSSLEKETFTVSAALTPELVEVPLTAIGPGSGVVAADPMLDVLARTEFTEGVERPKVVRFTSTKGTDYGPWFSIDHKGGSFLCRPALVAAGDPVEPKPLTDLGLPSAWEQVNAAVAVGGKQIYFNSKLFGFIEVTNGKAAKIRPTAEQWGRTATNLARTGQVDAVIRRADHTYLFSGSQYFCYIGTPFGTVAQGYPRNIATNTERFPKWQSISAAFTDLNGVEWFYSAELDQVVRGDGKPTPGGVFERHPRFDAAIVDPDERQTFLIWGDDYVRYTGDRYDKIDQGYPRRLADNPDELPQRRIGAALRVQNTSWYFDDATRTYTEVVAERGRRPRKSTETTRPSAELNRGVTVGGVSTVDAAWMQDGYLYLTSADQYFRYTLAGDTVPDAVDEGYPKPLRVRITAVFARGAQRYAFSGAYYARMGAHPGELAAFQRAEGNWGELPEQFDGVLDGDHLYFFVGATFLRYPKSGTVLRPFERVAMPIEVVRLTTSTAAQLNQRLLAGGVAALLDPASQEIDERPAFRTDRSDRNTIQVSNRVAASRLPSSAHLDFQSANGVYYWEIFCHAPVLIAQALNSAQRFADARQWYEYVFDPTETARYWRFLPFLAVDLGALADRCRRDMAELAETVKAAGFDEPAGLSGQLASVLADLGVLAPAFRENRKLTDPEKVVLDRLSASQLHLVLADAVVAAQGKITPRMREPKRTQWQNVVRALEQLQERAALVAELGRQYDLVGDHDSLIETYRRDPFDPHAIADLRPVAHRRSVVMAYVDNLLEWGDLLFRQYTMESIDEARMLYIFAWDLLGLRPERPGVAALTPTSTYAGLNGTAPSSAVAELTGGGTLLEGPGAVHAGLANGYFRIPDNSLFTEYWDRVEDRLRKIRASLDIMGVSRPLPLFEPPIDPMDLVRAVASGASVSSAVTSSSAVAVPHHRFDTTFRRAQELVDKLRQFGNDLLSTLDRRDAEELTLLQNRQEAVILELTSAIKDAQVQAAEANLRELQAGRTATDQRIAHYERLISTGLNALEEGQIGLMSTASALHLTAALTKIGSSIAYAWPQQKIGPFIMGIEWGGKQVGTVLDKASEITQILGEGFSITGELLGVRAQQERTAEDWQFQLDTARGDLTQVTHQIAAAEQQLASVRREAEIHAREIAHQKEIGAYLRDKFTGAQLYGWMAGRLSSLYFQAYSMAYETARAAERAHQFEQGATDTYIQPLYWESRRGGLLAGESLSLDLERLGQAHQSGDARSLEITRQVSLLALDPLALLRLVDGGLCEFSLGEDLFDRDFPGHFRRQIRTVSVEFFDADGAVQPNAMLTQLSHKTVLEPDVKAVRHLLDPKQPPPPTVRSDWRAGQRIALSQTTAQENNGLFELRYDDVRYLPFEGTGAVSSWRLELTGRQIPVRDVVITVRYTADDGGEILANAVKGMLKPFVTAQFFDLAADFPDEWQSFLDGSDLQLPFTPSMFPGIVGPITGVHPFNAPGLTLAPTDQRARDDGSGWTFSLDGDKESLTSVGLVLTYLAELS
ncbi:hemopexin repeat-containing protein [Lentzea sp. NPDC051838]|uniref:hemopexin repeat-containing protein n=1 Tax=Lentzea sp. NPDC051838 TaxID=3154849 RepID=UPI0034473CB1